MDIPNRSLKQSQLLEHALHADTKLQQRLQGFKLAIFLDYDGTLTPTTSQPEEAVLAADVRHILAELAKVHAVAIISGRDRADIKNLIQLPELVYAGSHGFDIAGSYPFPIQHEVARDFIPQLRATFLIIQQQLGHIPEIILEEKKYALAMHYRNVKPEFHHLITSTIENLVQKSADFKIKEGKYIIEICPNVDWDKGYGMQWIARTLQLNHPDFFHLYIGDDLPDEDAFKVLPQQSLGILVGNHGQPTYADYQLNDPGEVKQFLSQLIRS